METSDVLKSLTTVIVDGDETEVKALCKTALDSGMDPLTVVDHGLTKGMEIIGARFESGESFLPELLMAAEAFSAAMEIINPALEASSQRVTRLGTVVVATVKGDLHNIGKNILGTVLEINGFNVVDIGIDQSTLNIIEAAKSSGADIIALSSVMTTTMPYQKEVIDTLEEMSLRDQFRVMVGGGPVTQKWAHEIGADGYGDTAVDAVDLAKSLMSGK
jgi:corrinoid protein of di/trimethylamine methyltransferase